MKLAEYKTSKDYERLFDLAKTQRIICIVDYDTCRDTARTNYNKSQKFGESIEINGRGIGYVWAHSKEDFIKQCEREHVEFIEPDGGEEKNDHAFNYAKGLAESIHKQYYADENPNWKALDTTIGLLTQIDNMVTGLTRKADSK